MRHAGYPPDDRTSRYVGVTAVVVVHALLGAALIDGLKRPPVVPPPAPPPTLIQQLTLPPPPPPAVAPPLPARVTPPAPPRPTPPPAATKPQAQAVAPLTVMAPTPASPPAPPVIEAPVAAPVVAAPPAPPSPAPPRPAPAARAEIGVACPTQVQPEIPRRALQDGIGGVVRAQALIRGGVVAEVTILSGPRIFHAAVRAAMLQYRCVSEASEIVAVQEFAFRIE